jgi:hypothetical protein
LQPGENEFTASVEEVNRFIKSVREPKDLETTIASLRRVVAAQQEFGHIVSSFRTMMRRPCEIGSALACLCCSVSGRLAVGRAVWNFRSSF